MGEYAKNYRDEEVKIGTCEDMYYLRYEDRLKVKKIPNSLDPQRELNLRWRLPFPDEDGIEVGGYRDYKRGLRLYGTSEVQGYIDNDCVGLQIPDDDPGIIQLRHENSGLMINAPCHHGRKLPDSGGELKTFWNGKGWSLELCQIKNTEDGIKPIVGCRHCGHKWRYEWEDVRPYIHDAEMIARLRGYWETAQAA